MNKIPCQYPTFSTHPTPPPCQQILSTVISRTLSTSSHIAHPLNPSPLSLPPCQQILSTVISRIIFSPSHILTHPLTSSQSITPLSPINSDIPHSLHLFPHPLTSSQSILSPTHPPLPSLVNSDIPHSLRRSREGPSRAQTKGN